MTRIRIAFILVDTSNVCHAVGARIDLSLSVGLKRLPTWLDVGAFAVFQEILAVTVFAIGLFPHAADDVCGFDSWCCVKCSDHTE